MMTLAGDGIKMAISSLPDLSDHEVKNILFNNSESSICHQSENQYCKIMNIHEYAFDDFNSYLGK